MRFNPDTTEKLQKVLARAGLGSRRAIEAWIREGRVKVNQQVAHIGARVSLQDEIQIDNRKLSMQQLAPPPRQILIYNKPVGEVCSRDDDENRPLIFDKLPKPKQGRWISVGRLDVNTTGLLLLTTDGELANRLMHPSAEIEREYAVRVLGKVDEAMLQRLVTGVQLEDGIAKFERVDDAGGEGANHWYHVVLKEGRKREVRRLWEAQGLVVSRLMRIRYGVVTLPPSLRMGQFMELESNVRQALLRQVNLTETVKETEEGRDTVRQDKPNQRPNGKFTKQTLSTSTATREPAKRSTRPKKDWWESRIDETDDTGFSKRNLQQKNTAKPVHQPQAVTGGRANKPTTPSTAKFTATKTNTRPVLSKPSKPTSRPQLGKKLASSPIAKPSTLSTKKRG
ncbi:pseudouridine synthase family protein [Beggiatoa alba B18LD]|uniref:Pseudouridine synthase n=1 Tax=Beggiatoa alba B18LD TaxID=395493 RepID=I3CDN5_9GAMM|nr:pseudouridine synthase [Beggiatoa alba]EIJ41728.1 pseudouridine synthase family protein [Beggiatoa alba B18LD]